MLSWGNAGGCERNRFYNFFLWTRQTIASCSNNKGSAFTKIYKVDDVSPTVPSNWLLLWNNLSLHTFRLPAFWSHQTTYSLFPDLFSLLAPVAMGPFYSWAKQRSQNSPRFSSTLQTQVSRGIQERLWIYCIRWVQSRQTRQRSERYRKGCAPETMFMTGT